MNLYSLGKYFSIDTEGGEVKKWVSMINSALKAERSWGSHPRENLNRRAAGKEKARRPWVRVRAGFGYPVAGRTELTGATEGDTGSNEAPSPGY